jgi:hypothetical protein
VWILVAHQRAFFIAEEKVTRDSSLRRH